MLEVIGGSSFFGGRRCLVEDFGDNLADILCEFSKFFCLFLHQGVLSGLFGEPLQLVALGLVFFAEFASLLLCRVVPVVVCLIAELCGGGCVFAELFGDGFEIIDELLVRLLECLSSERGSVIADADGPWPFPNNLGTWDLSFVTGADLEFDGIALFDTEGFEVDAEFVGDFECAMVEWDGGDDAGRVLIFAEMEFEESDADIISDEAVEGDDIVRANLEAVSEACDNEYGWGVGCDDESAFGFTLIFEPKFVRGHQAESSAAECREFEHSGELIGGDGDSRINGLCIHICCRCGCGCTSHVCPGGGSGKFFRELSRGRQRIGRCRGCGWRWGGG